MQLDRHTPAPSRQSALAAYVLLLILFAVFLAGPLSEAAHGEPMWTTYHRDAQRSGYDPDATQPIEPAFAWQTVDLGAPIWNQPLVLGGRVYVATVGDAVYALDAATGKVVWEKSLGTPVPAGKLPCGDIEPMVGVVGTPVIDPARKAIYAVADTWDANKEEAHHVLKGLSLADGKEVLSTPVDPPGADPFALLQRTALNLDGANVVFGFGGNDGDCGEYRGTVVAAPENGTAARFRQYSPASPVISGGAVWATSGPAVDSAGTIYATTGNPNPPAGKEATTFDYSDSVLQLDLAHNFVTDPSTEASTQLGFFEPPTWRADSNSDNDLGSAGPELLPGGLLFQAGKNGTGYLIDELEMQLGAKSVFSGEVCGGAGSFGGDAFANGVIYIPCTNGVQALAYDQTARTFTPLWQGPSDAVGPPIVSGCLVWSVATGRFKGGGEKLYGLDPVTGAPRYTEILPSPVADHFASPSAAGGRLFVATGSSVSAYQIAQLPSEVSGGQDVCNGDSTCSRCPLPPAGGPAGTPATPSTNGSGATSPATTNIPHPKVDSEPPLLLRTRIHATADGRLRLVLRCTPQSGSCQGTITLRAKFVVSDDRGQHRRREVVLITLLHRRFGPARGDFTLTLRLDASAEAHLRRHRDRLALEVLIASTGRQARNVAAVLTQAAA
jgi:hypothetical protein